MFLVFRTSGLISASLGLNIFLHWVFTAFSVHIVFLTFKDSALAVNNCPV